jgi:hypothetical protein
MELASRTARVKVGEWFPRIHTKTIHGRSLSVPNAAAPFLQQFLSALLDLPSATFTCALLFGVILKSEVRVAVSYHQGRHRYRYPVRNGSLHDGKECDRPDCSLYA